MSHVFLQAEEGFKMLDLRNAEDPIVSGNSILISEEQKYIMELEAENSRLRQQLETANAQLASLMVDMKTAP
ncbi:hypothetical protein [uncultured Enterobacter sp.]|uniref:hypothetical protein n=1 Tax=uncultured Enterobacter sp. TaxID=238202 RepID=UPI00259738DC|nr:hypothetical protein [uncultured Enterobacter sp.]